MQRHQTIQRTLHLRKKSSVHCFPGSTASHLFVIEWVWDVMGCSLGGGLGGICNLFFGGVGGRTSGVGWGEMCAGVSLRRRICTVGALDQGRWSDWLP